MRDRRRVVLRAAHQVQLLEGGRELFPALVRAVDHAAHEVRMETYIFNPDTAGEQVLEALLRAAQRGVKVYLVVDGVGTPSLPAAWTSRLDAAGVQWRIFNPVGRFGLLLPSRWRRLHRKLCIVDGLVGFCGGINVLDDWVDPNHGRLDAPRLDFAVRVYGPLVSAMHEAMVQLWWRLQAVTDVREADWPALWRVLQEAVRQAWDTRHAHGNGAGLQMGVGAGAGARAALLLRDNLRNRRRIETAYRKAISVARDEIIIANAYFMPGRKLRRALIHAAQRGVKVRLLLQGRYEYFMQFHAVRPVYGPLLQAGVQIHEYSPSFLHAKVAVIDGHWATVGSSNLDPLSLLMAREANVVVDDKRFAQDLRQRLVHAMTHEGRRVDPDSYTRRPWHQRLLDRLAFGLARVAIFLSRNRY